MTIDILKDEFFSYAGLENFIAHMKRQGEVRSFDHWKSGPGIILRHDVDFNLRAAERMSKIEREMDVTSTFFILLTSQFYNILSKENRAILQNIASDGFEIGLHFDPMIYLKIPESELFGVMKEEAKLLSEASGAKVGSVSLHNPSVHNIYPFFPGYINAYNFELFNDSNYLSDSSMNFRGKDPYAFVEKARTVPVQVVLHPMHYGDLSRGYLEIFQKYIIEIASDIDSNFSVNQTYRTELKGRPILDVLLSDRPEGR